jgi:hypothetical protein
MRINQHDNIVLQIGNAIKESRALICRRKTAAWLVVAAPGRQPRPITGRSFFSKYGDASSRVVRVPHHGERFP